jgi:hypothetical protein
MDAMPDLLLAGMRAVMRLQWVQCNMGDSITIGMRCTSCDTVTATVLPTSLVDVVLLRPIGRSRQANSLALLKAQRWRHCRHTSRQSHHAVAVQHCLAAAVAVRAGKWLRGRLGIFAGVA